MLPGDLRRWRRVNWDRVFTGVLKLPQETTLTRDRTPGVTFDARSPEERYLQQRISVAQATFAGKHDAGLHRGRVHQAWLDGHRRGRGRHHRSMPGCSSFPGRGSTTRAPSRSAWRLAAAWRAALLRPGRRFPLENLAHWQGGARSTTTQFSLSRSTMDDFELRLDDGDLYNIVTVEASPRAPGGVDVIWEPDDLPLVAPGATTTITARFDTAAESIAGCNLRRRTMAATARRPT